MAFVVLEGFSGTGKTTLARGLERRGWLRLAESAHAVPKMVTVADRADTFSDYSLLGATMMNAGLIARSRVSKKVVSEGYLLSDLAYARIRFDRNISQAYPAMLEMCRDMLRRPELRPDLYVMLEARSDTISRRQRGKSPRDRNVQEFFRTHYYSALEDMHRTLGEDKVERVYTDSDPEAALRRVTEVLRKRALDQA